jgi:hypothetical protein
MTAAAMFRISKVWDSDGCSSSSPSLGTLDLGEEAAIATGEG